MSDAVDTSAKATAMIAYQIRHLPAEGLAHSGTREDFARHVEALRAERDAAQAEVKRIKAAWLHVIQAENSCAADGRCVNAKRCGCVEEMEMLLREHDARAALAKEQTDD
jgi:hypothetical protein